MNADPLVPSLSQAKLLLSVMRQFRFIDLACVPTRVTLCSSSQINVFIDDYCNVQGFKSTRVFPFCDHHLIQCQSFLF